MDKQKDRHAGLKSISQIVPLSNTEILEGKVILHKKITLNPFVVSDSEGCNTSLGGEIDAESSLYTYLYSENTRKITNRFYSQKKLNSDYEYDSFEDEVIEAVSKSLLGGSKKAFSQSASPENYVAKCVWNQCRKTAKRMKLYAFNPKDFDPDKEPAEDSDSPDFEYENEDNRPSEKDIIETCLSVVNDPAKRELIRLHAIHNYDRSYTHEQMVDELVNICAMKGYSVQFKLTKTNIDLIYSREMKKVRSYAKTINDYKYVA
ncbi:MAG: hypothetical protein MJZ99_00015 [Bacteroidales bacterium]|nr:hypothetical protein [Bacteroidales bacterium]